MIGSSRIRYDAIRGTGQCCASSSRASGPEPIGTPKSGSGSRSDAMRWGLGLVERERFHLDNDLGKPAHRPGRNRESTREDGDRKRKKQRDEERRG